MVARISEEGPAAHRYYDVVRPIRGQFATEIQLPWRLDGAAREPAAPLVLCLHGMGMNEDFFALLLQKLFALPFRFLIPRALYPMPVQGEGPAGASWYGYDGNQERFRRELEHAEALLLRMQDEVERTQDLTPRARVVLGFSQGGYLGAWLALRHPERYHGLVVSGARVKTEWLELEMTRAARMGFTALLTHGVRDPAVKPDAVFRSRDALQAAGVEVELRMFEAGHSIGREQVAAIAAWLTARFGGG